MAAVILTDAQKREAVDLWLDHGRSVRAAAAASGLNYYAYRYRLDTAKRDGFAQSAGVASVISKANLLPAEARGGWLHTYDSDGKKIGATRWANQDDAPDSEDRLAAIRAAFEGMTPADPVTPPDIVHDDLCNVFHMPDVHLGMFARAENTGDVDYDLPLAVSDLRGSFDRVMRQSPMGNIAVLLFNGDFFQCDDKTRKTPMNKHDLDAGPEDYRDVQVQGVELCAFLVQRALSWHRKVIVRVERGNHDLNSHNVLRIGLKYRFQNDASVEIDMAKRDYFMMRWGRSVITSTHGDNGTIQEFVMRLPSLCSWSMQETPHQYAFTGHKHRARAERIGPVYWEQADPIAPTDAYGSQWVGKRALVRHTFDLMRGRTSTGQDHLERAG